MHVLKKKSSCRICGKLVKKNQSYISCSSCDHKIHTKCSNRADISTEEHIVNFCFKCQDENLPFSSSKSNDSKVRNTESPFLRNLRNLINSSKFFDSGDIFSDTSPDENEPLINCKDLDASDLHF